MMSAATPASLDRLHDLLAERATQRLTASEADELASLLATHQDVDPDEYDWAAAAADVASLAPDYAPVPRHVRQQLEVRAVQWLAEKHGLRVTPGSSTAPAGQTIIGWSGRALPWLVAAACVVLSIIAWWPTLQAETEPAMLRAALINRPGTTTSPWATNDLQVTGDVVWNNAEQTGYLRIHGLAVNDPSKMQYQLWINDAARPSYALVDGGVFDVHGTGEVIVPIDAKIEVFRPNLFAVTTERPGGVVVHEDSEDSKIILAAPVT